ncbi:MAG: DUF502 domain-containing protein [Sedimentisphaerales bacterium]|nr:DUF502 domain-containing protein [Sedimentisphaerales bacterium]
MQQRIVVKDMRLTSGFRSYFLRGLAVLLPTILTIWIFVWGFNFIQDKISKPINKSIAWLDVQFEDGNWEDVTYRGEKIELWTDGWHSIAGFVIALIAVCIVGMILASVIGRGLWRYIEKLIMNLPFLKRVYPYIKQITDFVLVQNAQESLFVRVVAIQYPRKGIWSLGLVTGEGLTDVAEYIRRECLTVLIPTSPTPFTGFVIMIPKKDTIEMNMTIEEAMRFIISAGVIIPSTNLDRYKNIKLAESSDTSADFEDDPEEENEQIITEPSEQ